MGKKFDLAKLLQEQGMVSKLDTTGEIQKIDLLCIEENEKNFFEVEEDVTQLAESIQVNGLLQPLVVRPLPGGRYRIIAGHRRCKALRQLATEENGTFQTVPCIVVEPASEELEELMLIQTNTEARELSWNTKSKAAERVEAILVKLQQEQGVELPGKMRATVAQILKTSESQLARAKVIKEHLIQDFQKKSSPFTLNDDMCYKLARLDSSWQQELYDHYKNDTWQLDRKALKDYRENKEAGKAPFAPKPEEPRTCYYYPTKKGGYQKCNNQENLNACEHSCCGYCVSRFECPNACEGTAKEFQKHKHTELYLMGQRIKTIREAAGLSREDLEKELSSSLERVISLETGIAAPNIQELITISDYLHVSADFLLGRSEQDDVWGRGMPPESGYYLCLQDMKEVTGKVYYWSGTEWLHPIARIGVNLSVAYWLRLPKLPDGYVVDTEEQRKVAK